MHRPHSTNNVFNLKHSNQDSTDLRSQRPTSRANGSSIKPAADPLAAMERARRIAFEEEQAERWDGMA